MESLVKKATPDELAAFMLQQPLTVDFLNSVLDMLALLFPNPNRIHKRNHNPNLQRAVLLRRILLRLPTITEKTLDFLETLHELGISNLGLIRTSYLESAIAATLIPLQRGNLDVFVDMVGSVWVRRIRRLECSPKGRLLLSKGIMEWKVKMERGAKGKSKARDALLGEWNLKLGFETVAKFVREEFVAMGPSFFETLVAELRKKEKGKGVANGEDENLGTNAERSLKRKRGDIGKIVVKLRVW